MFMFYHYFFLLDRLYFLNEVKYQLLLILVSYPLSFQVHWMILSLGDKNLTMFLYHKFVTYLG